MLSKYYYILCIYTIFFYILHSHSIFFYIYYVYSILFVNVSTRKKPKYGSSLEAVEFEVHTVLIKHTFLNLIGIVFFILHKYHEKCKGFTVFICIGKE